MAVHIGQVTAEVTAPPATAAEESTTPTSPWAEQARMVAALARAQQEMARTASGDGHD